MHIVRGDVLERWNALTDEQLVGHVLMGRTALFEVLMRRHGERIYRTARAIVRNDTAAEDVIQQSFIKAYTNIGRYNIRRGLFVTWLTRIAVNESLRSSHRQVPADLSRSS